MPGGWLGVCLKDPDGLERVDCIHDLSTGDGGLLNAIYGKRTFERAAVLRMYARRDEARQAALAAEHDLAGLDLRRGLDKLQRVQGDDARELIIRSLLGHRRSDG